MSTIRGRIIDRHTGNTIRDAKITLQLVIGDRVIFEAEATISDGTYQTLIDDDLFKEFEGEEIGVVFHVFERDGNDFRPLTTETSVDQLSSRDHVVDILVNRDKPRSEGGKVSGKVLTSRHTAATGLNVVLYRIGVGVQHSLGSSSTDRHGRYSISYDLQPDSTAPDLQITAFDPKKPDVELGRSPLHIEASPDETINLIIASRKTPARASEYDRVLKGVSEYLGEGKLTGLEENGSRKDISYLSQKSGWDARVVAMTALSHEFTEGSDMPPDLYYALFRAGLPAERTRLDRLTPDTLKNVWGGAIEAGIIDAKHKGDIEEYVQRYVKTGARNHLNAKTGISISTYNEMLDLSLGSDLSARQSFMEKYLDRDDDESFWKGLEEQFEPEIVDRLRLDGKLGLLTYNNAPLMARLHEGFDLAGSPAGLVRGGLYHAEAWEELLTDDVEVPQELPGRDLAAKRKVYAEQMAAQLRLSFPEEVLSQQLERKEVTFKLDGEPRTAAIRFLDADNDFQIGGTPIEQYLKDKDIRLAENERVHLAALRGIKQMQRVYQLTPSDEAMDVLLSNDLDSAYSIAQLDESYFVERFAKSMGGEAKARMTYAKAQQVHGTLLNLALAYGTYRRNPAIYAIASTHSGHKEPGERDLGLDSFSSDVLAYPTLEALFGEMDFCECEHCRSVLSPAAYLVDLLKYIDQTENLDGKSNPIEILIARRPDIQHLALTCENTNTVLPYIDLVNEILEHQVVNGDLATFAGFNTDPEITTEELLANPQFVNDAAYSMLENEVYPLSLPYHDSLTSLRGYLGHLEHPLSEVLQTMRNGETLADHLPSYQEYLGLSPQEFAVLVSNPRALPEYYGMAPADNVHTVLLNGDAYARNLSRKLGLSYKDLTAIIATRWINPEQWLIGQLEPMYIPLPVIINFLDGGMTAPQLNALLPAGFDATSYGGDVPAWLTAHEASIRSLTLLVDTSGSQDPCNFAHLVWLKADGQPPEDIYYWKLLRFVRLLRALGWNIAQTDEALWSLYPAGNNASNIAELNEGMHSLLIRLRHLQVLMEDLRLKPPKDLLRLLPLWGDIGTLGKDSLYRKLFLNGAIQTLTDVFRADDNGDFLQDATQLIGAHLPALQAALNVSAGDMDILMARLGMTDATPLTLSNVSVLYRRAFLARALRISAEELEIMEDLTDIDPFSMLEDVEPSSLRFVILVKAVQDSRLKIPDLDYYLRHVDRSGKASPTLSSLLTLAGIFRNALKAVELQNTAIDDPSGDQAKALMAQVYGTDSADLFFGLLDETAVFTVPYDHNSGQLEAAITAVGSNLGYDDFAKTLQYSGVMSTGIRDALQAVAGVTPAFQEAVGNLFSISNELFDLHPGLGSLFTGSFEALSVEDRKQHYGDILGDLLPVILPQLKRLSLRQQLLGALGVEPDLLRNLLEDAEIVKGINPGTSLLDDLMSVEQGGFQEDSPVAGQTRLQAHLDAPVSTHYGIFVETDGDAVTLEIDGATIAGTLADGVWNNDSAISLTAGQLVAITIIVTNASATPVVKWAATGLAKTSIPADRLFPPDPIKVFREAYLRLLKSVALAEALELDADELRHFATFEKVVGTDTFVIHWLNALPVPTQNTVATPVDVFRHLSLLLEYVNLRELLDAEPLDLIEVLKDPTATHEQGDSLLWLLTGWVGSEQDALLAHFGWAPVDLRDVTRFLRMQTAYGLLENTGLSASLLLSIATNSPTADQVRDLQAALRARYDEDNWLKVAGPLHDTLRNQRRDVLVDFVLHQFSLNPASSHIDTANKLFEFFLIDVEMDACMKTSRIKQALSSIQLFIYRCFLNLEKSVSPKVLNAQRWEWMKRYRVWEANRKVFLYPENWLDPELRDNKSPFFKELESELLQSDINDEKASTALAHYLEKLDTVAKLDICGTYLQENQIKKDGEYFTADDILHVIGRTPGANRKYYYRRYEYGYWTPWEKIDIEIEDNPVLPVIWNDRLYLFWLSIMTKGQHTSEPAISLAEGDSLANATLKSGSLSTFKVRVEATLCYSSFYNGGWQPQQTSDLSKPLDLGLFAAEAFPRDQLTLDAVFPASGGVAVYVSNPQDGYPTGYFRMYNRNSRPVLAFQDDSGILEKAFMACASFNNRTTRHFKAENKQFSATYNVPFFEQLSEFKTDFLKHVILKNAPFHEVVFPGHHVNFLLEAPFFFQDRRHAFHVFPEESIVSVKTSLSFGYTAPEPSVEFVKPDLLWEEKEIFDPTIYQGIDPVVNAGLHANPGLVGLGPLEKRFADSTVSNGLFSISAINFKGSLIAATGSVDPAEIAANKIEQEQQNINR